MKIGTTGGLKHKLKMFPQFIEGIRKQWKYGSKKYAPIDPMYPDKEATDYICDRYPDFIESTIDKYLLRWHSQHREEDLFKVATYCFILWLKYFTGEVRKFNIHEGIKVRKK